MFVFSFYSHITLNGSPFYGETPLNKKQKYKVLAYSLKTSIAPIGENTVMKILENWTEQTKLASFKRSLQWGIISQIIWGLQQQYVFG